MSSPTVHVADTVSVWLALTFMDTSLVSRALRDSVKVSGRVLLRDDVRGMSEVITVFVRPSFLFGVPGAGVTATGATAFGVTGIGDSEAGITTAGVTGAGVRGAGVPPASGHVVSVTGDGVR